MSQFRRDPLNGGWVIIATERGKRPSDFGSVLDQKKGGPCSFCQGHEDETPPEVLSFRDPGTNPDQPGWRVRVVPNKFAAVHREPYCTRSDKGLFADMTGHGMAEVVIETPKHNAHLCDLPVPQVHEVILAYQQRMEAMLQVPAIQYVQIFKNWGSVAGASLEHTHSQLIGIPVVPRFVQEQMRSAERYRSRTGGRCLLCDIVEQELEDGARVVARNEFFVALTPYASRFPFETHIYPYPHHADFEAMPPPMVDAMARMLKEVLFALRIALLDPPFNFIVHSRPRWSGNAPEAWKNASEHFHWHMEIIPRLTRVAGFEWGTGFYINPTPPEQAAEFYRDVLLPSHFIESGGWKKQKRKGGNRGAEAGDRGGGAEKN